MFLFVSELALRVFPAVTRLTVHCWLYILNMEQRLTTLAVKAAADTAAFGCQEGAGGARGRLGEARDEA